MELRLGETGASARLDASPGIVPIGVLNQRLLDAATHAVPHDDLARWCKQIPPGQAAYPVAIP